MPAGARVASGPFQDRVKHADHRAERSLSALIEPVLAIEMAEQFVGAVYQMDNQITQPAV